MFDKPKIETTLGTKIEGIDISTIIHIEQETNKPFSGDFFSRSKPIAVELGITLSFDMFQKFTQGDEETRLALFNSITKSFMVHKTK